MSKNVNTFGKLWNKEYADNIRRATRIFQGQGFVVEIGHKDVGFQTETFRAVT